MKKIIIKNKEYLLATLITIMFAIYYLDLLKDGMIFSGIISAAIVVYIGLLWSEKVADERDEYIRAKTDRVLYIITIFILLIDIVYKTFSHLSYMSSLAILTCLAISKLLLSRMLKNNN